MWNAKAEKSGIRKKVFCGSMCDVMEDRRDLDATREQLYDLIEKTPFIDWQLLTKRPQNFLRFLPSSWIATPRFNVWLMTTVGVEKSLWRIEALKNCPARVYGLSVEPLLEDLPTLGQHLSGIDWVIVGGESGPGSRAMHPDWARSVRDQCLDASTSFFFKQWGDWIEFRDSGLASYPPNVSHIEVEQTTQPLQCRRITLCRVGKKVAGRLLDGREWNEMPEVIDG